MLHTDQLQTKVSELSTEIFKKWDQDPEAFWRTASNNPLANETQLLPVRFWRQSTIKAMAIKRWNWPSQSKSRPVKSKPWQSSLGCSRHFACWLFEGPKNDDICLVGEYFEKARVSAKKGPRKPQQSLSPLQQSSCSLLWSNKSYFVKFLIGNH